MKIGDIYIRNSDGKVYRLKWIDHKTVVLESEENGKLTLANISGLEKAYRKRETQLS